MNQKYFDFILIFEDSMFFYNKAKIVRVYF
jgi:hypothetical protein